MVDHFVKRLYTLACDGATVKSDSSVNLDCTSTGVGVENERAHFQYVGLNAIAAAATVGGGC